MSAGQPVRRLRLGNRPWPAEDDVEVSSTACVNVGGYSVHAATAIKAHERDRLEKLVRYMARPAIADDRLSLTADNSIKLRLKNQWRDGTESILFSPSEFIEKLIALVPIPRFHLTRYYGVFANRSQFRSKLPDMPEPPVNPQLGVINEDNKQNASDMDGNKSGKSDKRSRGKHYVTWAALLRRTFGVDVLQCPKCKSHMSLVAVVSDARTIAATLTAIGVSPRAPPIAPACGTGVFGYVDAEPIVEWDD
jgi:hypothetical protein